ncbi:hypothetical protein GTR02_20145 [Kineococcus sp. R8]|uniref:hypothetical protein n=1 Tax=Kineococcus siccus TaxID=2696567 RepID=UPI0014134FC0|nr:hypothetical protein [Kineococcus siccus]NAZ84123.1 hypothetical protein [Kineococcus siccus]
MQTRPTSRPAPARRLAAPSWRDPRLLVGLALVLASVLLGARAVGAADRTTEVFAVATTLGVGRAVGVEQLQVVRVHVDAVTAAAYVPADRPPAAGAVVLRALSPGELLPRSALGSTADLTSRPVTLQLPDEPPQGVSTGAQVDVWVTTPAPPGATAPVPPPRLLVEAAEVADVRALTSGLAARRGSDVQVLVPLGALPDVLQALADDLVVDLVPVPGSGAAGGS